MTKPKLTQADRDLIRYTIKMRKRALLTHLRHVSADHYRTSQQTESEIMRRIALKLHAAVEHAIDRVHANDCAPLFRSPLQWEASLIAARRLLGRSR